MKTVTIALLCVCSSFASLRAQDKQKTISTLSSANTAAGKFHFKTDTHDYGEVPEGPKAEYDFVFKNVGSEPIVITEAHGSCGCTVPDWPHEPIKPGKKGKIRVTYNTAGRPGPIQKDVIITSNAAQSPMVLHITGIVKPKAASATAAVTPPPLK